ncbi:hypothetical protein CL614_07460 [archaeon]|nr:hypothetical protein [archaeon]|tara:strand:- start:4547 stop:5419 length:873 start_codon:yes stop_codon:yes gene_type:complete
MTLINSIALFSRNMFGKYAKTFKPYLSDVQKDIEKTKIGLTLEEYISVAIFTCILTFFIETIMLTLIFAIVINNVIFGIVLGIGLSIILTGIVIFLFYLYPSVVSGGREKNIDRMLPFAVSYLTALSSGSTEISSMFKTLGSFKKYGEISAEANTIARNIDMFGMTAVESIKRVAERTPSEGFKDLLFGINTVLVSGGDLMSYLDGKSNDLMADYRRTIRKYSNTLSLFVEIYLTLLITGSVFFIVLSSVISVISGGLGTVLLQTFVVFVLLPIISAGFILLIKSTSPTD